MKRKLLSLWIVFFVFMAAYFMVEIDLWAVLYIWTTGIAIYLLIKNKLPSKKRMIISVVFAILVSIVYAGLGVEPWVVLINGLMTGIPTLLCSMAVFAVMEKQNSDIKLISNSEKYAPLTSIVIGVVVGAILSVVNFFLMKDSNSIDFEISVFRLMVALNPAICEEMAGRAIFMAFCLYKFGDERPTRFQQFTMWFMMCFPHTAAHNYDIIGTVVLCVLFGLPFAYLQRNRDIASAMISHGLVDAVRFSIFSLGI